MACQEMKILSIPPHMNMEQLGLEVIVICRTLLLILFCPHEIPTGFDETNEDTFVDTTPLPNCDELNQKLIDFHHDLPPLHKACLDIHVSIPSIQQCIETHGRDAAGLYTRSYGISMTPMHILAYNPHADSGTVLALLHANKSTVFETCNHQFDHYENYSDYMEKQTPLDVMRGTNVDCCLAIIKASCRHREDAASRNEVVVWSGFELTTTTIVINPAISEEDIMYYDRLMLQELASSELLPRENLDFG